VRALSVPGATELLAEALQVGIDRANLDIALDSRYVVENL
jgi:hypothetical protein